LEKCGISVSRSTIPNDPNPPMKPSGVRFGTPAVTTRGMKEAEIVKIVEWIDKAIENRENEEVLNQIQGEVKEFCQGFPIPSI
jgi:glycine hydroxymethyltransferase